MANNFIPVRLEYSGGSVPTGWAEYQTDEAMQLPGNLSLSGTGRRITGDMSNATVASRLLFQTSTTNGATSISAIPNGTSSISVISAFSAAGATNCSFAALYTDGAGSYVSSDRLGTGTYLPLVFTVGGAERMRIDTAGYFMYGQSNITGMANGSANKPGSYLLSTSGAQVNQCGSDAGLYISKPSGYSSNAFQYYFVNNVQVGSITTTGSATAYNTSSDYRLKDDVQPLDPVEATDRVMAYRPVTWTWKTDGSYGKGFIAHECQAVDPMTATGTKDAVEQIGSVVMADGTVAAVEVREPEDPSIYGEGATWELTGERPVYQGRDDSKMIPDMVAMMQRMELRIRELEAQLQQVIALLPAA